ncbi:MAG: histone H1 [Bacteroidota bacterium]
MNHFHSLHKHIKDLEEEFEKFYEKGNKVAGTRIRKGMQELKELAQKVRVDIQSRKVKTQNKKNNDKKDTSK